MKTRDILTASVALPLLLVSPLARANSDSAPFDKSQYDLFNPVPDDALRGMDTDRPNITNTPQYGYPSVPDITTATSQGLPFGQITNTVNTPRQFQFGARFTF